MQPLTKEEADAAITTAIALINRVPGYESIGQILTTFHRNGRLRYDPHMEDRGGAYRYGSITIGPEAISGGTVGLSATLVHERYHQTQPLLIAPYSLWTGVFTRTPIWRIMEQPAYRAAYDYLVTLEQEAIQWGDKTIVATAKRTQIETASAFEVFYGIPLIPGA